MIFVQKGKAKMSKSEMIKWLQNLKEDIGQSQHQDLWHYAEVLDEVISTIRLMINDKGCGINDCYNCDVAWSSRICFERRGYTFDKDGVPHE